MEGYREKGVQRTGSGQRARKVKKMGRGTEDMEGYRGHGGYRGKGAAQRLGVVHRCVVLGPR